MHYHCMYIIIIICIFILSCFCSEIVVSGLLTIYTNNNIKIQNKFSIYCKLILIIKPILLAVTNNSSSLALVTLQKDMRFSKRGEFMVFKMFCE